MPLERTYVYSSIDYVVTTKEIEEFSEDIPKVTIENMTECILVVTFSSAAPGAFTITEEIEPGKTLDTTSLRARVISGPPKTSGLSSGPATGSFTVKQKDGADIFQGTVDGVEVTPRKHAVKLTVQTRT